VSDRILRSALSALLLVGTLAGCKEQISGNLGCPELCTDESVAVRDTILMGSIVVDSTFLGFPRPGDDRDITMWNNKDTADVRIVARFDSLPVNYQIIGASSDSVIRRVDSASLIFTVDTLRQKATLPITIDAYDVDTTAVDSATSALFPLFRPRPADWLADIHRRRFQGGHAHPRARQRGAVRQGQGHPATARRPARARPGSGAPPRGRELVRPAHSHASGGGHLDQAGHGVPALQVAG